MIIVLRQLKRMIVLVDDVSIRANPLGGNKYLLLHDKNGVLYKENVVMNIEPGNVLGDDNPLNTILTFVHTPTKPNKIQATEFAYRDIPNPLTKCTRVGWGSGVRGYLADGRVPDATDVLIRVDNPLYIIDEHHGDSLTRASMACLRECERVIKSEHEMIGRWAPSYNLFSVVFDRLNLEGIGAKEYVTVMTKYCDDFLVARDCIDSENGRFMRPQPLNYLMDYIGYDSIVSDIALMERGCISLSWANASTFGSEDTE